MGSMLFTYIAGIASLLFLAVSMSFLVTRRIETAGHNPHRDRLNIVAGRSSAEEPTVKVESRVYPTAAEIAELDDDYEGFEIGNTAPDNLPSLPDGYTYVPMGSGNISHPLAGISRMAQMIPGGRNELGADVRNFNGKFSVNYKDSGIILNFDKYDDIFVIVDGFVCQAFTIEDEPGFFLSLSSLKVDRGTFLDGEYAVSLVEHSSGIHFVDPDQATKFSYLF